MKMYHFNTHGYGDEYFVMAENKVKALEYLIKTFEKLILKEPYFTRDLEIWSSVNPLDDKTFPDEYTLDECPVGYVVRTESC